MLKTVSIIVSGKVQGVYYRQSAKEKARELNITGEVKNLPDDTVYIIATGKAEQLNQFIEWCRQGPPRAKVLNVITDEMTLTSFEKFNIVR
ncbi:MAG TPA: acylphosphatase [Chitinophagaceae bacterium]|nr:acylphosphatase [Chitinophagaceae bacterium]